MKILTHEGLQYFYNQIAAKFSTKEQTAEAIEEAVGNAGVGTVTSVNGKTGAVTLTAGDVGALPASTVIPDALSDLISDATHRTVTDTEKATWNAKSNFSGSYNDLTNKPTIPSISGLATETYVNNKVAAMVDSAPDTLNTLNELAAALGDDPNFATTVATEIGGKVSKSGDTMTGDLIAPTTYAKGNYPNHGYMNADGIPVVLMQVDASNHRLAIHQKRGGASVWESNEAYMLPAPNLDQTATVAYDILTSKNPVTVAQGGTGATDRKNAFQGLAYLGDEPIKTVNTDTTSEWGKIGTGYTFYMNNLLNNQPSQYGILINYVRNGEIFQIWNAQMGGPTYFRSGNASGWADNGWRKVFDSSNYPNGIKYGNAGIDIAIASTPIITARNNDIANWALERHGANDELTVHFYNSNGTWTTNGRVLATNNFTTYVTPAAIGALPISGGTLTGALTLPGNLYAEGDTLDATQYAINMKNSNIVGVNGIYMNDAADGITEGVHFYRSATTYDSIWAANGKLYFTPNRPISEAGTAYTVYHTGNKPSASDVGAISTPVAIAASTDLNNVTTPGFYHCAANATVATLANTPTGNAFYMEVGKHAGVYQRIVEYTTAGTAKIYIRNYYAGTWSAWGREYTTWNKPTASEIDALPTTPAQIEFMPGTSASHGGYIDFHFNSSSSDHTSRIIEQSSGTLTINGATFNNGTITATKIVGAVYA